MAAPPADSVSAPALSAPTRPASPGSVDSAASATVALPDKEYFKIGEVSRIVGVETYVLRFWESEFKRDIRPERSRSNQRMYRRRDVETFLEIKRLRYEEKLELSGARRKLRKPDKTPELPFVAAEGDLGRALTRNARPVSSTTSAPGTDGAEISTAAGASDGAIAAAHEKLRQRLKKSLEELIQIVDEDERGE